MKSDNFARLTNERGNMLLLTYFVIIIMVGLGTAFTLMSINETKLAERNRQETEAFHIADAGIEMMLYHLRMDFEQDPTPDWFDGTIYQESFTPGASYSTIFSNVPFNDGTYTIELKESSEADHIWVKSTGIINDSAIELEAYVKLINLSPWDNAIFAGSGASGTMINGNVDIRGSVHVLGDGLAAGDYAMDLGGTAQLVGNNYNGLDAGLEALVPALPTVVFNGESVETLNAELRVKKGIVGLSGSSSVGETDVFGNGEKETVDAVYVTDGYGGTSGDSAVYSDNGTTNGYDLGDAVEFPSLAEPYEGYADYRAYLVGALGATVIDDPADLTQLENIDPNSSFTVGNCASNCVSMDGAGNMTVNGIVVIDPNAGAGYNGNLVMTKDGGDKTITYSGKGTLFVSGDVGVHVNLITSGASSYPTNIVGVMTPNDIDMNEAGIDVMGLFYAEDTITVQKQTDVMGTIVSNYFDMGTNVPSIYQVPEVMNNLPGGLIGSNAYWYDVEMWRKL